MRVTLTGKRARATNRIQKLLEDANIKLGSVVADVMGKSGRAMLWALIEGKKTPKEMAELALGAMRPKVPQLVAALEGKLRDHHRFMLGQHLAQAEFLEGRIAGFDARIEELMRGSQGAWSEEGEVSRGPFDEALRRLDPIPRIDTRAAETILAEIGTDMSRFPSAHHLASWAGVCPGNNESTGKRRSGRTNQGNRTLKSTLVQSAWGAARTKKSYFHALYHRLKARRGHKKAVLAVAHALLVVIWTLLSRGSEYADLGPNAPHAAAPEQQAKKLVSRLEALGYKVTLNHAA